MAKVSVVYGEERECHVSLSLSPLSLSPSLFLSLCLSSDQRSVSESSVEQSSVSAGHGGAQRAPWPRVWGGTCQRADWPVKRRLCFSTGDRFRTVYVWQCGCVRALV